jgi:hypothetical protein
MASAATYTGVLLLVALVGLGVAQSFLGDLPSSTLAGAVTADAVAPLVADAAPTQRELNLCMNACMDACVKTVEDHNPCIAECEPQCGIQS